MRKFPQTFSYDRSAMKASIRDKNDDYVLKLPTVIYLDIYLDSISDEASTHCGDHTFGKLLAVFCR